MHTKYFSEKVLWLRLLTILKTDYYIMYCCRRSIYTFHCKILCLCYSDVSKCQISILMKKDEKKCTEIWSEKVPDLSHLEPISPTFGANLDIRVWHLGEDLVLSEDFPKVNIVERGTSSWNKLLVFIINKLQHRDRGRANQGTVTNEVQGQLSRTSGLNNILSRDPHWVANWRNRFVFFYQTLKIKSALNLYVVLI